MIVSRLRTWGVLLILAVQLVEAEVTLENGAYRNIVVSFSSNLPSDQGEDIVKNTKDLLEKTSLVLQKTLGVSIGQVTFAVPDDWEVSSSESIPRVEPDILVDNREGSPFGKGPFAEQYGGCGVRGTHIDVPYSFLTREDAYPKEKLLAREWLKFRYGVFDEHGFPGDSKYPDHYTVPGDEENVKVTECTDPAVEYLIKNSNNETCSLGEENCRIYLGDGADEVKSSLMYLREELENVDQVCGQEHQHNFMSPSKQNILCSEKSIWDVLNQSGDELKDQEPPQNTDIEYRIVKFSKPKMLILLEATSSLKSVKEEIIFALKRVLFDLPEGTHLGLKTFVTSGTKVVRGFSELGKDRSLTIGANFDAPSDTVCPLCILENNMDVLPKNEPGLIVLITASNNTKDNSPLLESLKNSNHFLLLITITDDGVSLEGYSELLKELTHLNQAYLSEIKSSKIDLPKALYTAIISHFQFSPTDPFIEIVFNGIISDSDGIEIPESQLTEEVTIWMDKNLDPDQLVCIDENGAHVNLTESEESSITRVTYKAEGPVNCELAYGEERMVQVTKPSKSENIISASTWVHDTTPKIGLQQAASEVQMPVILYAKINYGSYPVSPANVEAVVKDDEDTEKKFFLKDDGKGDPDITKGDGIYSGYFFEFAKEGFYNVKVNIKTDASQTKAIKIGNDRCCGFQVEPKLPYEDSTIPVPAFEKTVSTIFRAISSKPENGYPPSKILDLRVTKFEPPSVLELSWTAPGGEVDQGNATHYDIKVFCDSSSHCQENGTFPGWISPSDSLPIPDVPGQIQRVQLSLSDSTPQNTTLRITMETVRGTERSGPSNSVRIWLQEKTSEDPSTTTITVEPTRKNHAIAVGNVIGWTVVGILVFFCLGGLVYFLVTKKRRSTHQKETAELDASCTKRSDSFRISEGKRADSFPVLLYTHDQVKDVRERTRAKDPPLYRASGAPPKPWVSMGELGVREGSQGSDGSTARVGDGSAGEMRELDASSLDVHLNLDGQEVKL